MALSSGYSIQRTEIIDIPHRQHVETHSAVGTNTVYPLRSKPDFSDKSWIWEIKIGEVKISLNRKVGNNLLSTPTQSALDEYQNWQADTYTEGSLEAGEGVVRYITNVGQFGAIEFLPQTAPVSGEKVEIRFQESQDQWTGSDGGLMYQLAKDLTTHPYEIPEVFRANIDRVKYVSKTDDFTQSPLADYGTTPVSAAFSLDNKFGVQQDYTSTDTLEAARSGKKIWRSVKEFSHVYPDQSFGTASAETDLVIGNYPLTLNDLGDGEFRIAVQGKVIPASSWKVSSDSATRSSKFVIDLDEAKTWGWVTNRQDVEVEISYIWKHSLDVPYGALIGRNGLGPTQEALATADYGLQSALREAATSLTGTGAIVRHMPPMSTATQNPFGATDNSGYIIFDIENSNVNSADHYALNTFYADTLVDKRNSTGITISGVESSVFSITINKGDVIELLKDGVVVDGNTYTFGNGGPRNDGTVFGDFENIKLVFDSDPGVGNYAIRCTGVSLNSLTELTKMSSGDAFMLTYEENEKFTPGFNLIYPSPVSNSPSAVRSALRDITDSFLVESTKGVDLLSDDNLVPEYYQVQSQRRPQKWRLRFQWDRKQQSIKVHVATEYQLLNGMEVTQGQDRDGIKSPVYREPGELCDIYLEPNTGRTVGYEMVKSKSDWFRRSGKTEDNISRTYPMSYRLTVTDHGVGLFLWDQASVDQDDDYAWFVVQRHVDQTTGQPEFTQKSPVHCLYSPTKRPVDISDLNQYYASSDVNDLTKSPNIYTSLGQMLETEGPTMFISASGSTPVFNGFVNALDFTGFGYTAGLISSTNTALSNPSVKSELDRGIIGGAVVDTIDYWNIAEYESTPSGEDALRGKQTINLTSALLGTGNPAIDEPLNGSVDTFAIGDFYVNDYPLGEREIVVTYRDVANGGDTLTLVQGVDFTIDRSAKTITLLGGQGATAQTSTKINPSQAVDSSTTILSIKVAAGNLVENRTGVADLQILGFEQLPRDGQEVTPILANGNPGTAQKNSNAVEDAAGWLVDATLAPHYSGNVVFPTNRLERVSSFQAAAANNTAISDSVTGATLGEWSDPSYALLDILYNENVANMEKVLDSLIVAIDGEEIERDDDGYVLQYDEWTRAGDPRTVSRFIQSLDASGVTNLDKYFRLPAMTQTVNKTRTVDGVPDTVVPVETMIIPQEIVNIVNGVTDRIDYDPASATGGSTTCTYRNDTKNDVYDVHLAVQLYDIFYKYVDPNNSERQQASNSSLGWLAGTYVDPLTNAVLDADASTHAAKNTLVKSSITSSSLLTGKMSGDPVFSNADKQLYIYDFFNQTLFFRTPPRDSSELIVKLVNYVYSDPARNSYYIVSPPDRDFPERNQNKEKTINRFVVREQDVLKPWDYHVSATMHEVDSHAVINPQEQLSITQDRDFVFSFPTQLTSQRFYYPRSELDLLCISSADFSTQSGSIEIDKYQDSNGLSGAVLNIDGQDINPSPTDTTDDHEWGGHIGPSGDVFYWKRNKRKYEGMMSTMPNGNGMRVFLQVSGSSIKYTDVVEGAAPA